MNVLFLTLVKMRGAGQGDIYSDLVEEFAGHGHEVYVVSPVERREGTRLPPREAAPRVHLHFAAIGNYYGAPWLEKGATTALLSRQYVRVVREELGGVDFGLLLYSTPPVTLAGAVRYVKGRWRGCVAYLMLKDIWPQAMADLGLLRKEGLQRIPYAYFERQERRMYRLSDRIGCMSPANEEYVLRHNRRLDRSRVGPCPNAAKVRDGDGARLPEGLRREARARHGLPEGKTIFVFGGSVGPANGVDFMARCLERNEGREDSFILIVGQGPSYGRLEAAFREGGFRNAALAPRLPQGEYAELVRACDVGLIFLDHRFTVPNFPSKLLSYMRAGLPVLVASDTATDIGPIAEAGGFGHWCESDDPDAVMALMDRFRDEGERREMGARAFRFMREHYSSGAAYGQIMRQLARGPARAGEAGAGK